MWRAARAPASTHPGDLPRTARSTVLCHGGKALAGGRYRARGYVPFNRLQRFEEISQVERISFTPSPQCSGELVQRVRVWLAVPDGAQLAGMDFRPTRTAGYSNLWSR